MARKQRKRWARSFGPYGCRVRVFETSSGVIYAEIRHSGRSRRESLAHRDRARAVTWAEQMQAELVLGIQAVADPTPIVSTVFAAFLAIRSPRKLSEAGRRNDRRAAGLWRRFLGDQFDLAKLSDTEWSRFLLERSSGAIDSDGRTVLPSKRQPVRSRTVGADCEWLRSVLRWATKARDVEGRYYLWENPMRGFEIPQEKNPRRPVASQDRYEAIREVSDRVVMEVRWGDGRRRTTRSYLSEVLDIVNGTGRRISAVLRLRCEDLTLEVGPHGCIRWSADADKIGQEWAAPINVQVRAALDRILRERPGIGRTWLFPSPKTPLRPVSKELASTWLRKAERLAALPPQTGSLWHAYRRKWATERKHLPTKDVAAAGGWKDLSVLQSAYQQVDEVTLYRVVSEPTELREKHHVR